MDFRYESKKRIYFGCPYVLYKRSRYAERDFMNVEGKKKKTVVIISCAAALAVLLVCGFIFLNFKSTLFVTLQVCRAEKVSKDDYLEFRIFEKGETRESFKSELETRIRRDTALEKWQTEEPIVREMIDRDESAGRDVIRLLTFAVNCKGKNYEDIVEEFGNIQFTEEFAALCSEHSFDTGDIASYIAALYAEDVFYIRDMDMGADHVMEILSTLSDTDFESDEKVYKLNITEYDPVELCAEQDASESEYMELCRAKLGGDSEYEYIVKKTLTAHEYDSFCITVFAAANTEAYKILGLYFSVPEGTEQYIPGFSLNIDGTFAVYADGIADTVRLDAASLREATDKYAALFGSLFEPLADDAALEELYDFFYADAEEAVSEETEGTKDKEAENENSEESVGYDDLSFVQQMNMLGDKIENDYPVEEDWGLMNIFSMYQYTVNMIGTTYVDYRYLAENFEELFSEAEDKSEVREDLDSNMALLDKLREIIRNSGDPEFAGVENICEWNMNEDEFNAQYGDYLHKWYPDAELPEFLYTADVKYSASSAAGDGNFYDMQFTVGITDSGMRIIGIDADFNDTLEELLSNYSNNNLWQEPNYIFMRHNAEESVNRDDYAAEEEYDLAIARWLYQNYPEYYNNPDAGQAESQHNYTASGYSAGSQGNLWGNIKEGVSDGANGILGWIANAGEYAENWELDMQGYLDQIWFDMEQGEYGNLPWIITYGTNTAKEIGNEIKEAATDAWSDVKDWWGGLWR